MPGSCLPSARSNQQSSSDPEVGNVGEADPHWGMTPQAPCHRLTSWLEGQAESQERSYRRIYRHCRRSFPQDGTLTKDRISALLRDPMGRMEVVLSTLLLS